MVIRKKQYEKLNDDILQSLNLTRWMYQGPDASVNLKSSKSVDNYVPLTFFKENKANISVADKRLIEKEKYANKISTFLKDNSFKNRSMYSKIEENLTKHLGNLHSYNIEVYYVSPAGRSTNAKMIYINRAFIDNLKADPSLTMGKAEYNKYLKENVKKQLDEKIHLHYEKVNDIIDKANTYQDRLVIKEDHDRLDKTVSSLFEKTVNSIKKIKTLNSDEWSVIQKVILNTKQEVDSIIDRNQRIIDYYSSPDFEAIKTACKSLMESQKDFNEYINEKAQSISTLFGSRIVRTETEIDDEYNYIRPYKKSITPFTAEVSSQVFSSAENNPIEYIIRYFYPNKELYPEQIQKLQLLI